MLLSFWAYSILTILDVEANKKSPVKAEQTSPQSTEDILPVDTKGPVDVNALLQMEDYYKQIAARAPPEIRAKCYDILANKASFSTSMQDAFTFHTFFKQMMEPGVYLDIGPTEATTGSNTYFFDACLGWKGVVIELEPSVQAKFETSGRTAKVVDACIAPKDETKGLYGRQGFMSYVPYAQASTLQLGEGQSSKTCYSFRRILTENAAILGEPDEEGRWGSNINYVAMRLDERAAFLLGCSDIKGVFSAKPAVQLWSIETKTLSGEALRTVDASMMLAGYVKALPSFDQDRTFLADIYVMMRDIIADGSRLSAQHRCPSFSTCILADIMASKAKSKNGFPLTCDLEAKTA